MIQDFLWAADSYSGGQEILHYGTCRFNIVITENCCWAT